MLEFFLDSSLSPSQLWTLNTTEALEPCVSRFPENLELTPRCVLGAVGAAPEELGRQAMDRTHHPTYLLRVKIAAMGSVDDRVVWNSAPSPRAAGS